MNRLHTIQAGQIQNAEMLETNENGEKTIHILAEDGTNYEMVLSRSLSVEYIENIDTGEYPVWPVE